MAALPPDELDYVTPENCVAIAEQNPHIQSLLDFPPNLTRKGVPDGVRVKEIDDTRSKIKIVFDEKEYLHLKWPFLRAMAKAAGVDITKEEKNYKIDQSQVRDHAYRMHGKLRVVLTEESVQKLKDKYSPAFAQPQFDSIDLISKLKKLGGAIRTYFTQDLVTRTFFDETGQQPKDALRGLFYIEGGPELFGALLRQKLFSNTGDTKQQGIDTSTLQRMHITMINGIERLEGLDQDSIIEPRVMAPDGSVSFSPPLKAESVSVIEENLRTLAGLLLKLPRITRVGRFAPDGEAGGVPSRGTSGGGRGGRGSGS